MSAASELVAYGYIEAEDGFVRYKSNTPRDKWTPTVGGFLRFTREDGKWTPVPYKIAPAFEGVSGLLYSSHPGCFDMVYPESEVEHIYAEGNRVAGEQAAEAAQRKAAG